MSKQSSRFHGFSIISVMIGMALLAVGITGALRLLGISLAGQNALYTKNLVNQVSRLGEIMTAHLNRGGSFQNPDVEAKGIQLCTLQNPSSKCNGYQTNGKNFCLSIPSRVSLAGNDEINVTGFRLLDGVLYKREASNVNMATFNHGTFCEGNSDWLAMNDKSDFEFTEIRFCKFLATNINQVTANYDQNCTSVIENNPKSNMFWVGLLKAKIGDKLVEGEYEEARIIHLLNTTRVRIGS